MKASKKKPRIYLQDILSAIERIKGYTSGGKDQFLTDEKTQDAVLLQLSLIGEASVKLPAAMKATHKEIPWKDIVGMRNMIVHEYLEIKIQRTWDTIEQDLPILKKTITAMLEEVSL